MRTHKEIEEAVRRFHEWADNLDPDTTEWTEITDDNRADWLRRIGIEPDTATQKGTHAS